MSIRRDWHLDWAGRRNTFCPVEKEEGLCRQREQQAQRGSVKGPLVSGGGEKFTKANKLAGPGAGAAGVRAAGGSRQEDTKETRGGRRARAEPGPAYRAISGLIRVRAGLLSPARLPGR